MQSPIGIIIADSQPVVRCGIKSYLEDQSKIRLLGEANSCTDLMNSLVDFKADVVILDTVMPDGNPLETTKHLVKLNETKVIMFSSQDTWGNVQTFINAGCYGFVSKRADMDELTQAIMAVADKRQFISPIITQASMLTGKKGGINCAALSPREHEVAVLVAEGLTSKQIAGKLEIQLKTIETHRYRIFKKLNIVHCAQLAKYVLTGERG